MRKLAFAAGAGTALEWYDFGLYGLATALIFQPLFFPAHSSAAGLLATFATFALGFVARPIGSIIFGHIGDRVSRKGMLALTLGVMGVCTFVVGLLPTYETIGVWAPISLVVLRIVQGLAVGGEYGGAAIMLAEQAPPRRRGFWTSWVSTTSPLGTLVAFGVFALVQNSMSKEAFLAWGWRIPFLLSILILVVGLVIRSRTQESAVFVAAKAQVDELPRIPIAELLRNHGSVVVRAVLSRLADSPAFFVFTTFGISYITTTVGASPGVAVLASTVVNAGQVLCYPFAGMLSDRIGRKPTMMAGAAVLVVVSVPAFLLINTGNTALILLGSFIGVVPGSCLVLGAMPSMLAELFPTPVRCSGTSFVYQTTTITGGVAPFVAAALLSLGYGFWPIVAVIMVLALVSIAFLRTLPEVRGRDLHAADVPATA
ncbi:MAG: hypothetical protein ABS81_01355 [Pseudonocardia sp. SCN 72-86]|nr:MAG: hypothetical protein ABS81_01355 [Pseudonocardia sp. SCN 72-86]